MRKRPFHHETRCTGWDMASKYSYRVHIDDDRIATVLGMEVRRIVVVVIHLEGSEYDDEGSRTAYNRKS